MPYFYEKITAKRARHGMPSCAADNLYVATRIMGYGTSQCRLMLAISGDGFAQRLAGSVGQLFVGTAVLCPYATSEWADEAANSLAFRGATLPGIVARWGFRFAAHALL